MMVPSDTPDYLLCMIWGLPLITYAPRGRGGSSLLYISIAYYMQKGGGGGEGVQKACKIAYVINGRPLYIFYFF